MSFIVAGNWKMNKGPGQTREFLTEFAKVCGDYKYGASSLFFAPAINLVTAGECCQSSGLGWGPQNIYWENSGAFTGENSPEVVKEIGATHALVGHSERRSLFGETDEECNKKMKAILSHGMCPVLCIGETLDQRKSGQTLDVLKSQLEKGLAGIGAEQKFHVAYEPVWAIGTGEVATPDQVKEAHEFIRKCLSETYSNDVHILYGGSVKGANAGELSQVPEVGGFLVGGASLKVDTFCEILKASE